jgi:hypothetical protein
MRITKEMIPEAKRAPSQAEEPKEVMDEGTFGKILNNLSVKRKGIEDLKSQLQSKVEAGDFDDDAETLDQIRANIEFKESNLSTLVNETMKRRGEEVEMGTGVAREAAAGLTWGVSPYIEAGARAITSDDTYGQSLDMVQREREAFEAANPEVAIASNIGGSLLTGGVLKGGLKAMGAAGKVAKAVDTLSPKKALAIKSGLSGASSMLESAGREESTGADVALSGVIGTALGATPFGGGSSHKKDMVAAALGASYGATQDDESWVRGAVLGAGLGVAGKRWLGAAKRTANKIIGTQKMANNFATKALGATVASATKYDLGRMQTIGQEMNKQGLASGSLTKKSIVKKLMGDIEVPKGYKDEASIASFLDSLSEEDVKGGAVKELVYLTDQFIDEVEKTLAANKTKVNSMFRREIYNGVQKEMLQEIGGSSGIYDVKQAKRVMDEVEALLIKHRLSIKDLQEAKRYTSRMLKVTDFNAKGDGENMAAKKEALVRLNLFLKKKIEEFADSASPGMGEVLQRINQRTGHLFEAGKIAAKERAMQTSNPISGFEGGMFGATAIASSMTSNPLPIVAGMSYIALSRLFKSQGAGAMADILNSYRIPRSSTEILSNKSLVMAKLMVSGAPKIAEAVNNTQEAEEMSALMGQVVKMMPKLFSPAPANSEFDGKVLDPIERSTIVRSIKDHKHMTNTEKARAINKLNSEKKLELKPQ